MGQQLKPETRAWLQPLVNDKGYSSFAQSCNWADHIKSDPSYDHLKPMHYVNLAKGSQGYSKSALQCDQRSCITRAIPFYQQQLQNQQGDQAQALLLLGHFVGDVHQPMHVSFAEDWGGNKLTLKVPGEDSTRNLHWLWDVWIIEQPNQDWQTLAQQMLDAPPVISANTPIKNQNVHDWAAESFSLALTIYRDYHANAAVNAAYRQRYAPFARERIWLAGTRLAMLLESIYQSRAPLDESAG